MTARCCLALRPPSRRRRDASTVVRRSSTSRTGTGVAAARLAPALRQFSAIAYDEPRLNPVLASIAGTDEPFRLSPSGVLQAVLEEAGFSDVEVEHVDAPVYLPDDVCVPFRLLVGGGRRA